jgi:hypothetical protein
MKALHRLQKGFAADLWGDDAHRMQGLILDDQLSAERRFNVYRNNFQSSLIDALAATYPVVKQLVGSEFFGFMADRYIRANPSRSGNLHNLGYALADFLSGFRAVSELPYLADVARVEWACHAVFHASAAAPFEPTALDQANVTTYPQLRFNLGPACRMLSSPYPIFRIWKVNQDGYTGDQNVELDDGPESVLAVRPELDVELWQLDPAEAALLGSLASGKCLDEAVQASLKHSRDFNLQVVLAKYFASGVLVVPEANVDEPPEET